VAQPYCTVVRYSTDLLSRIYIHHYLCANALFPITLIARPPCHRHVVVILPLLSCRLGFCSVQDGTAMCMQYSPLQYSTIFPAPESCLFFSGTTVSAIGGADYWYRPRHVYAKRQTKERTKAASTLLYCADRRTNSNELQYYYQVSIKASYSVTLRPCGFTHQGSFRISLDSSHALCERALKFKKKKSGAERCYTKSFLL